MPKNARRRVIFGRGWFRRLQGNCIVAVCANVWPCIFLRRGRYSQKRKGDGEQYGAVEIQNLFFLRRYLETTEECIAFRT